MRLHSYNLNLKFHSSNYLFFKILSFSNADSAFLCMEIYDLSYSTKDQPYYWCIHFQIRSSRTVRQHLIVDVLETSDSVEQILLLWWQDWVHLGGKSGRDRFILFVEFCQFGVRYTIEATLTLTPLTVFPCVALYTKYTCAMTYHSVFSMRLRVFPGPKANFWIIGANKMFFMLKWSAQWAKIKKPRKIFFRILCRTLTGNLTGNLFAGECRWDFIFSSDRELNSDQDRSILNPA